MSILVKRRKFKFLRKLELKKCERIDDYNLARQLDMTFFFYGTGRHIRLYPQSVRMYNKSGARSFSVGSFYYHVHLALEELRGRTTSGKFEVKPDHEDDSHYVMFYGFPMYESDMLKLLEGLKHEYGNFMEYER